jgi:predicted RNase H-like nuclease
MGGKSTAEHEDSLICGFCGEHWWVNVLVVNLGWREGD